LTGVVLALLLVSTVSAMTIAGPRVLQVIGEDFRGLSFLGRTNRDGIPSTAIYLQSVLTLLFILTSTFQSILVFAGFTLALNSFATVLGIFVLRAPTGLATSIPHLRVSAAAAHLPGADRMDALLRHDQQAR
jgi:APA family basic amino acid/polyamine antiporter